jgi:hypothetical protein
MTKIYLLALCAFIVLFATSSINLSHSSQTGIVGYTGAPGSFGTCASCHGGGSASTSGITITAVPAFTNHEYMPDTSYQITVSGSAAGFGRYGFAAEILTSANVNAGTITANTAGGVKLGTMNSQRKQAIHTSPKVATVANFTFPWKAPAAGKATIYAILNAVNGNANTNGDFPITPVSMVLEPMPAPVDTTHQDTTITTSILERANLISSINVYPNPASTSAEISFTTKQNLEVNTIITDIKGREILRGPSSPASPGKNTLPINVQGLSPGIYFLQINSGQTRLGQKIFVVN